MTRALVIAGATVAMHALHVAAQPPRAGPFAAPRADFTVTAGDFYLHLPAAVPAGWRTVRFHNGGRAFHHAVFLRVQDARGADSVLAALARWREDWDRPLPGAASIGGVEGSLVITSTGERPGEDTFAVLDLRPGLYLVLCMIPSDGVAHAARGMHALLRVQASPAPDGGRAVPTADAVVTASDYSFQLTPGRLTPGWRLVEVTSTGPAEHVAEFARLKPGRRLADVVAPRADAPPADQDPEAAVIGGSTRLARGAREFVWLRLVPGRYVVQCPLHDAAHHPHFRLGMVAELEVR